MEKVPIYLRKRTEPHGYKPHYEGSENSYSEHSHGKKDIQCYKEKEELSEKK